MSDMCVESEMVKLRQKVINCCVYLFLLGYIYLRMKCVDLCIQLEVVMSKGG